jgi:hypothetical protein
MHPYVAESRNCGSLYITMTILVVASAWLFQEFVTLLLIDLPWWVESPSVLGFFGICWKAFDLYVWRWKISRWVGWTEAPDLCGDWQVAVETQVNNQSKVAKGEAKITQTATHLSVVIRWEQSRSYSAAGVIQQGRSGEPELIYQYINEPHPDAPAMMQIHRGTA